MQTMTVTECVHSLNNLLERQVVSVEGEVRGFAISHGKWGFFSLRDAASVLECFYFAWRLNTPLEDGMAVRVLATPGIHPRSGRFRLHVERVELIGEGSLQRAFELLRLKLEHEGLFSPTRKRPLSAFPRRLGLICSRESAAYVDFLRVLGDRFGGLTVYLAHVPVQGPAAAPAIVAAFQALAAVKPEVDLIVLTRGGGSLEDLQPFNSEVVARAIFQSPVPVVSAVGHERDITIADLAADVRAATPSNAAELVVPDRRALRRSVSDAARRSSLATGRHLSQARRRVLDLLGRSVVAFSLRRQRVQWSVMRFGRWRLEFFRRRAGHRSQLRTLAQRLIQTAMYVHERARADVLRYHHLLEALNPERLLRRGFSIVRRHDVVVKSASAIELDDALQVTFSEGSIGARVVSK